MTDVRILAGTLTASREDRAVTGLLLPFGEVGNTSLGRFSVDAGVFEIPADPMVVGLDVDHERERPVGRATSVTETAEGIVATFAIARTPEGDQVLDEIESGERRSLSAEVAEVVIRSGKAIAGRLFGAAVCAKGAFPSAALYASDVGSVPMEGFGPITPAVADLIAAQTLAAAAAGSTTTEEGAVAHTTGPAATLDAEAVTYTTDAQVVETISDGQTVTTITTTQAATETYESAPADSTETTDPAPAGEGTAEASDDAEEPEADEADTEEEATVPETLTATVPAGSMAARTAQRKTSAVGPDMSVRDVATLLASAFREKSSGAGPATLLAALDQITAADVFDVVTPQQWIGKLWDGKPYVERYAPLIGHADLTGPKVIGWRFVDGKSPTVASYAGFPNQPTSNEVDSEVVEEAVSRIAGAWAVDRIHRDFPSVEFWTAFFAKAVDDYAKKRDAAVIANMVSDATAVAAGAAVQPGVSEAAIKIVDGFLAVSDYATPTFAVVGADLWRDFVLTRRDDSLEYLSAALGLGGGEMEGFRIVPAQSSVSSLTNKVLVGAREAQTLHELPGVPVRVDAEAIATGGLDEGMFGYYAIITHNAKGLALVADA